MQVISVEAAMANPNDPDQGSAIAIDAQRQCIHYWRHLFFHPVAHHTRCVSNRVEGHFGRVRGEVALVVVCGCVADERGFRNAACWSDHRAANRYIDE